MKEEVHIPPAALPALIIHWQAKWYPDTPIHELKEYLEPRLRETLYSEDLVRMWMKEAENWLNVQSRSDIRIRVANYKGIRLVA